MSDYTKSTTRKFRRWWRGIKKHSATRQQEILLNWLKFACKTAAIRCDQHQQKVIYTTYNRYEKSQHRTFRRWQAEKVWMMVNQKQENYKRQVRELNTPTPAPAKKPNVVVQRVRHRRIITGANGHAKSS